MSPERQRRSKSSHRPRGRSRSSGPIEAEGPVELEPLPVTTPAADPAAARASFGALGLTEPLLSAVVQAGFQEPTDIQTALIPVAISGRDCLGQARTGTGKTAAFTLPILQLLTPGQPFQVIALVPTRELAAQVDTHVRMFAGKIKTAVVYGGHRISQQLGSLKRDPEIIVGTPGRILDLIGRKLLSLAAVKFVVLDEVDRMLDIGFRDDIRRILSQVKGPHQTIFVSATLDDNIRKLAQAYTKEPVELDVSGDTLTVESVEHGFVSVAREDKFASLLGFLKGEVPSLVIVFTNTKHIARRVAERLRKEGVSCQEIHGDLDQRRREKVMHKFRNSAIQVLVATDLASRGLDVMEVSHIVNYDIPQDAAVYVHRIGRTARMGQRGYAVTFVTPEEGQLLTEIEMLLNTQLPQFEAPWAVRRLPLIIAPTAAGKAGAEPGAAGKAGAAAPEGSAAAKGEAAAKGAAATKEAALGAKRFSEPWRRDEVLEAIGLRPQRRTLGSRFRSSRKRGR
jgi:ATP-dependent RNA helicase DeaD